MIKAFVNVVLLFLGLSVASLCWADDKAVAAVVNGVKIYNTAIDDVIKLAVAKGGRDTPEGRQAILSRLIKKEVLVQQAYKLNLDKGVEFQKSLDNLKRELLTARLNEDFLAKNPISESEVKADYDKKSQEVAKNSVKEYKVSSILVASEAEAKAVISRLKAGEAFEKVAREKSIGPLKNAGGLIGWAAPGAVLPAISKAMVNIPKGSFSQAPVQSRLGWHVIKVDNIRPFKIAAFDEVKNQLKLGLIQQKRVDYVNKLVASANVVK